MAVRIVTDSTSDLPKDMAEELGVTVVPLTVFFGEEAFRDGVDMDHDEFFDRLGRNQVLPKTSQPSVGAFLDAYRPLVEQGHEVVSIHVSSKLSGTINSARGAVQELPEAHIEIIDSGLASLGLALVVRAAAEAANHGASWEETAKAASEAASNTGLYFVLDTLEYLQKGGRIGRAQALLGSLLSIKPVLTIVDGEIHPYERVRTRAKAVARLKEIAQRGAPYEEIGFIHETTAEEVAAIGADLQPLSRAPLFSGRIGPVVGTYTGPGVIGVALRQA